MTITVGVPAFVRAQKARAKRIASRIKSLATSVSLRGGPVWPTKGRCGTSVKIATFVLGRTFPGTRVDRFKIWITRVMNRAVRPGAMARTSVTGCVTARIVPTWEVRCGVGIHEPKNGRFAHWTCSLRWY